MDKVKLYHALKILRSATPGSIPYKNGYAGVIAFSVKKDSDESNILLNFFHCNHVNDSTLICHVVGNNGLPLEYDSNEVAMLNSHSYSTGLEKKFIFECYRSYGVKLDVPVETVVSFIKREKK